jgi:hypothetical protein
MGWLGTRVTGGDGVHRLDDVPDSRLDWIVGKEGLRVKNSGSSFYLWGLIAAETEFAAKTSSFMGNQQNLHNFLGGFDYGTD